MGGGGGGGDLRPILDLRMAEPILLAIPVKRRPSSACEGGVGKTMDRRMEPKKSCI
ncbi:hypothetical protein A2U01_0116756, partial [Trifolium medium]|nr:hypothetical protein [Trifolium medium]